MARLQFLAKRISSQLKYSTPVAIVFCGILACTSKPKTYTVEQEKAQVSQLNLADDFIKQNKPHEALKQIELFQKMYPNSSYYLQSELMAGEALILDARYEEGANRLRQVMDRAGSQFPKMTAQGLYLISYCYEGLGDEIRLVASLQDAQKRTTDLSEEKIYAEIPARLAAAYFRMGREEDSKKELAKAEQGVLRVRNSNKERMTPEWLAQIYFEMGSLMTNPSVQGISDGSIQKFIDSLRMLQGFLLKSIEADAGFYSQRALENLKANYSSIWTAISLMPLQQGIEPKQAQADRSDIQTELTKQLLVLIVELRQIRAPEGTKKSERTQDLYAFLDQLDVKAQSQLLTTRETTELTDESKKMNSLKRLDLTPKTSEKSKQQLPVDHKSSENKDPNF